MSRITSKPENEKPQVEERSFNGFQEPNYTPVPDEFFDRFLPDLTVSEFKVFLYIVRRTLGFKKRVDAVSLTQICEGITRTDGEVIDRGTGLTRQGALNAIDGLLAKGLIRKITQQQPDGAFLPNLYSLRFASANQQSNSPSENDKSKASFTQKTPSKADFTNNRLQRKQQAKTDTLSPAPDGPSETASKADCTGGGSQQALTRVVNRRLLGGSQQALTTTRNRSLQETVLQESSSSPTPPPPATDRLRPNREEEDFHKITEAVNHYAVAGTKFAQKLLETAREVDNSILPGEVAMLVHASVPRGYAVQGPGYFLSAVPPLVDSPARKLQPSRQLAAEDVEAQIAFVRAEAQRILADPGASPEDLAFARKLLGPEA